MGREASLWSLDVEREGRPGAVLSPEQTALTGDVGARDILGAGVLLSDVPRATSVTRGVRFEARRQFRVPGSNEPSFLGCPL